MNVKKVALLVGALVIAVVTAVMAKNMFAAPGPRRPARTVPTGPKILVARKALPVGTIIDAESLAFQPWPKELVQNAYYHRRRPRIRHDPADRHGCPQPDHGRPAGDQGSLVGPNDRGFLAAALGPGMRAVTVPVFRPPAASPASSSRATESTWC